MARKRPTPRQRRAHAARRFEDRPTRTARRTSQVLVWLLLAGVVLSLFGGALLVILDA